MDNLIAFKGKITLEKAVWDNISGMTVIFALEQRPHELTAANPFKKFTKMRSGKVGTRFNAVIVDADEESTIMYDDDLMLKGWNDGTNGWKVTFWINSDAETAHPFMIFDKGAEFQMAVVELDDDEEPIDQVKRDRVKTATKARRQGLSNFAALLCRTPDFHEWLKESAPVSWGIAVRNADTPDIAAKHWICNQVEIESRAELDSNTAVAGLFHSKIRRPYAEWMEERG